MGKAVKCTRFRNVKIKVVRRSITGPAKFSYLGQAPPQPNSKHTHSLDPSTSITPQQAEPDDVAPSCSYACSETAYSKAKKRELHAWDAVKDDMLTVSFECSAPFTTQCVVCLEKHADYRCIECSTTAVFCEACLKRTHRNSLHLPDKWNNAYYEPSSLGLFLYLPEGHNTHTVYTKDMKVIVSTGRLCTVTVKMCACEPETCTLLRSTPFTEPWWENPYHDHDFGFVRKQSSGTSAVEPLHGTRMFVDEKDVEDYLLSHLDSSKPHEDCSNFKAGNVLRSQQQAKKLDVTGVFGASCRHEMPLMFVNMSQGERLAYPLYVIDALLQRCEDKNIHLRVVYDIACVVASHLQGSAYHTTSPWPYQHFMFMDTNCPARFARVTKEMTPSHRLDLLTDALLHYGRRKSTDLD
ncbi:uncharacterized protein LOC125138365 isoform X2 [Tachysurus fulvidraco]|uniref:uncharacterized protein LOC125138365 isoform X2 n=1 Tax=Tachysurus fulvidraco TaxID=1234273 RepID=UPI001FF06D59|nr:uncharacterized protein LOC125138365 isoform X2 [Tachysurus fulvidraco]